MQLLLNIVFLFWFCCVVCCEVENTCIRLKMAKMQFNIQEKQCFQYFPDSPKISTLFTSTLIKITSVNDVPFKIAISNGSESDEVPLWLRGISSVFGQRSMLTLQMKVSPFKHFTFAVTTYDDNTINILTKKSAVDFVNVGLFIGGMVLINTARELSRSTLFHYSSGMSLGIATSFLIILFILYKLLPYKKVIATGMVASFSITLYMLEYVWSSLIDLICNYPFYVASFCSVTGMISAALIYYYGPPQHERTFNLIQWSLQLLACYMIYQSSYCVTFSITVIVLVSMFQYFSFRNFVMKIVTLIIPKKTIIWLNPNPPKKRFLTLQEYDEQGEIETKKALAELKVYCSSPQCDAWGLVGRLQTPRKFASFLKNGEHLCQEELDAYEEAEFSGSFHVQDDEMPSFNNSHVSPSFNSSRVSSSSRMKEWLSDDENMTLLTD